MKLFILICLMFLAGCSVDHSIKNSTEQPNTKSMIDQGFTVKEVKKQDSVQNGLIPEKRNINENQSPNTKEITIKRNTVKQMVLLNVPIVNQMPEQYNGCEIASITMLLQHAGVKVNKFDVAKSIPKDDDLLVQTPTGDILHWGNPNHGFVGSITGTERKGYGVYNQPIQKVIEHYLPQRSLNMTGKPFSLIENQIQNGKPVVVLTTTSFTPPKKWDPWKHGKEIIHGTMELHAVVVVGFDPNSVYVNDPYTGEKARKINKNSFVNSWTALGKQAVSYR